VEGKNLTYPAVTVTVRATDAEELGVAVKSANTTFGGSKVKCGEEGRESSSGTLEE
jgi:hypothetical protein